MTQKEFIKILEKNNYAQDDLHDEDFYGDELKVYLHNLHEDIIVEIDCTENKFSIYRYFPYMEEDKIGCRFTMERRNIFYDFLEKRMGVRMSAKQLDKYCPFGETEVGLYDNEFDEIVLREFLKAYIENKQREETIDYNNLLLELIMDNINYDYNEMYSKKEYNTERMPGFIINYKGTHAISTKETAHEKFSYDTSKTEKVISTYIGKECLFLRTKNYLSAISLSNYKNYVTLANELLYGTDSIAEVFENGMVFISNHYFTSIHMPFTDSVGLIKDEYEELKTRIGLFEKFSGWNIWEDLAKETAKELDFNKLTASQFEQLCFDILILRKYQDVKIMGKTNAPDGGIDIFATECHENLLGITELRKWIFQCKLNKKTLTRTDIQDIGCLLKENNAERYGLFCSNFMSPSAIERLKNQNKELSEKIIWYSKTELEKMLINNFPNLIVKYNLRKS